MTEFLWFVTAIVSFFFILAQFMIWHHVSKIHEYMARTAGERKGTRQGVAQDQGAAQGDVDEKLKVPDNSDQVPFGLLVISGFSFFLPSLQLLEF